ncbi:unnamed protein product [Pleuronectes platessa]|uniref:Uncharacterized protein n=1 Tax=Pleuronectes platessa TaxID=8262 RepID=A0A9N7VJL6_PLEPL|nr:unnamed protein product [Pleuronectes platessa]
MRTQHCAGKEWLGLPSRASSPGNGPRRAAATHSSRYGVGEESGGEVRRGERRRGEECHDRGDPNNGDDSGGRLWFASPVIPTLIAVA